MSRRAASSAQRGFTIVELLIVVVVIAVLAAITIVAFNGITQRAKASAASAAAKQAVDKVQLYAVTNGEALPNALADAGVSDQNGTSYQYRTYDSGKSFCITATTNSVSYYIDNGSHSTPTAGACAGHGANGGGTITNLAVDPAGTSTSNWTGWAGTGGAGSLSAQSSSGITPSSYVRLTITTPGTSSTGLVTTTSQGIPVTAGETYSFRIAGRTNRSSGVNAYLLEVKWRGALGQIGGSVQTSTPFLGANVWHYISRAGLVAPAGATSLIATAVVTLSSSNTVGDTYDATGLMVEQGSVSHPYADGNSPGWVWNGTPNNSTSTGPAQ